MISKEQTDCAVTMSLLNQPKHMRNVIRAVAKLDKSAARNAVELARECFKQMEDKVKGQVVSNEEFAGGYETLETLGKIPDEENELSQDKIMKMSLLLQA